MRSSRLRELPGCTENTEDQKDLPQQRQVHATAADLLRSGFLINACLIIVWSHPPPPHAHQLHSSKKNWGEICFNIPFGMSLR